MNKPETRMVVTSMLASGEILGNHLEPASNSRREVNTEWSCEHSSELFLPSLRWRCGRRAHRRAATTCTHAARRREKAPRRMGGAAPWVPAGRTTFTPGTLAPNTVLLLLRSAIRRVMSSTLIARRGPSKLQHQITSVARPFGVPDTSMVGRAKARRTSFGCLPRLRRRYLMNASTWGDVIAKAILHNPLLKPTASRFRARA